MAIHTIRLPAWLSAGMIFQQGVPLSLYGYAQEGSTVKLEVVKDPTDGRKVSKLDADYGIIWSHETRAAEGGKFAFELPPYKPSTDAYTFIFSVPQETISVKDLRCGDVWLMIGSVPFSVPISAAGAPRTPLKDSALQQIRFFVVPRDGKSGDEEYGDSPVEDIRGASWITARAGRALSGVSSVGFSLAYHLADQLHYPVGIIDLPKAGSSVCDWISRASVDTDTDLQTALRKYDRFAGPKEENGSKSNTKGHDIRKDETKHTATEPEKAKIRMSDLYNYKLFPLRNMNIRGILYAPDACDIAMTDDYELLMRTLLADLSSIFGPKKYKNRHSIPSLIMLQLRPAIYDREDPFSSLRFNESLCAVRRRFPMKIGILGQHDMLLPDRAMSFYIGRRLSFVALGLHFTPKMPTSSPECIGVEIVGSKVLLSFDNTSDGLKLSENESVLRGFSLCGADRVYRPAQAKILHGVRVMVWHEDIPEPRGVTYGFRPIPQDATFKSRADLPVLPFRFDRSQATYCPDLSFANCDRLETIGIRNAGEDYALLPVFQVIHGSGHIFPETLNKTEGAGSLRIEYVPEDKEFAFGPVLRYASILAPLDLSAFRKVKIDIFNPDLQTKRIEIDGFAGDAEVARGLKWQTVELSYEEGRPMKLEEFAIRILDDQPKGSVYIDNIRFL